MKNNKKGFTLAELLIVVAIIAVLVAIAIPIFTNQLEKSREATDAANIRAAYAEVAAAALADSETGVTATVELKQQVADWQNTSIKDIAGVEVTDISTAEGTVTIKYEDGKLTIAGNEVTTSFITSDDASGATSGDDSGDDSDTGATEP